MALNQFSDMTFAEFKKLYLWSEPQVGLGGRGSVCEPGAAGGSGCRYPHPCCRAAAPRSSAELFGHQRELPAKRWAVPGGRGLEEKGEFRDAGEEPGERWGPGGRCGATREAGLCGAVRCGATPVRFLTQGPCGSCWTFSTTGCLESAIAIATGKLLSLVGDNGPSLGTSGGAAGP